MLSDKVARRQAAPPPARRPLQLRADGEIAYHHVAQLMSDAARLGLTRSGFVTDPSQAR